MAGSRSMLSPMWKPGASAVDSTNLARFMRWLQTRGATFGGYTDLLRWSVDETDAFWRSLWEYFAVASGPPPERVVVGDRMPHVHWFPDVQVNYAEHLLAGEPGAIAVIAYDETGSRRELTYRELRARVGAAQAGLA